MHGIEPAPGQARRAFGHAVDDEQALAAPYRARFAAEIAQLGFGPTVATTMLGHEEPLVAIRFTIAEAFEQTPGPAAGERLAPGRP